MKFALHSRSLDKRLSECGRVMRIAIVNQNRDRVGGVETYLEMLIPAMAENRCDVAFLTESDHQAAIPIALAESVAAWSVQELGIGRALEKLREWKPDVVYAHGHLGVELMSGLMQAAPAVFYAHGYYGTCISGAKSFKFPVVRPCTRRFGPGCLLHYYPHRCGGLNPITMWRNYHAQSERSTLLRKYAAILAPSEYIGAEYLRHGFSPDAVRVVPYAFGRREFPPVASNHQPANELPHRLLFMGRMVKLKGGMLLLEAVARAARELGRTLHLALAGDGPERSKWQRRADSICTTNPNVHFEFMGWLNGEALERVCGTSDLLVVPSLWPEPSALVGREVGLHGVPQAAFAVGGNPEWLIDGVNGHLAPGDPPTAAGLADAIVKCLADPAHYALTREGAVEVARQFTLDRHIRLLLPILQQAAGANGKKSSQC
jgi:glycosyltransferase involved in cell wall biosynthesis